MSLNFSVSTFYRSIMVNRSKETQNNKTWDQLVLRFGVTVQRSVTHSEVKHFQRKWPALGLYAIEYGASSECVKRFKYICLKYMYNFWKKVHYCSMFVLCNYYTNAVEVNIWLIIQKTSLNFDWSTHIPKAMPEYKCRCLFLNLKLDLSSICQKRTSEK